MREEVREPRHLDLERVRPDDLTEQGYQGQETRIKEKG